MKLRATTVKHLGAALLLALTCSAHAAPESAPAGNSDAVMSLLTERGLVGAAESPGVVQTLRERVRDTTSDLVLAAMHFIGVPYRRGGASEDTGFDCSGFTRRIFELSIGLVLPHRADDQASSSGLLKVAREELKPGDLVFFNTMRRTFSHVGIYLGDDKFIHSPRAGAQVRIEDMRVTYWAQRFTGARRAELSIDTSALPSTR